MIGSFDCLRRLLHVVIWAVALLRSSVVLKNRHHKHSVKNLFNFLQISTSVIQETNAVQMPYVIIFMDHTIALVKKAIMEMAKTAEVNIGFLSF